MLGNNISNKQAPYVMFDIDSLLFSERKKETVFTKVADMFKTTEQKYIEREIDKKFIELLNVIWYKHNVCIGLVTFEVSDDEYYEKLVDKLDEHFVPYTRLFKFAEWEDLRNFSGNIYTFSKNMELISYLSQKHALHIDRIREVL